MYKALNIHSALHANSNNNFGNVANNKGRFSCSHYCRIKTEEWWPRAIKDQGTKPKQSPLSPNKTNLCT